MTRATHVLALSCSLLACTGQQPSPSRASEPKATAVATNSAQVTATPTPADTKSSEARASEPAVVEAKAPDVKTPDPTPAEAIPAPDPTEPVPSTFSLEPTPSAPPDELAIRPWSVAPRTAAWTLVAEPPEALALVDLNAGVLGRAGGRWWQIAADGAITAVEMNIEPELPILGVWPTDAWFVNRRFRNYDDGSDMEYLELRLMKLRGGNRWVPQVYSGTGEQWFHPGTDDEDEPHMSATSGMLVYPRSLERITRVAGRHGDPVLGPHRGDVVDFLETASGKVHVLSRDAGGTYAQIACEDDACVATNTRKLPLSGWTFGRRLARGKHSVSVLATGEARAFMLHHDGKSGGWRLDEFPAGETPNGMWASAAGGLWTLTGARLRRRDTDGTWYDVALPEGMTGPTVAVDLDRARVWVSGVVGGAAKVFTTPADASP